MSHSKHGAHLHDTAPGEEEHEGVGGYVTIVLLRVLKVEKVRG